MLLRYIDAICIRGLIISQNVTEVMNKIEWDFLPNIPEMLVLFITVKLK